MRDFHRLQIWRRSHVLAIAIHQSARRMRGNEYATLRSQLTRAADSVPSNIVEGCGADSPLEFARYLELSIKSAAETEHHLINARDRRVLSERAWRRFTDEVVEIRRMTHTYRRRLIDGDE
jgi:four helix bundle protein